MTKDLKVKPKRKKIASLDKKKARAGWFFVLPFAIAFLLIYLPIVYDSIIFSFSTMNSARETVWVGWDNYYQALFVNPKFSQTLLTGIGNLLLEIPMILIFSLFMAVLLNQKMAGRAVFRAIFFIPVILSTGIMEAIAAQSILADYMDEAGGIEDGSGSSAAQELVSSMDVEILFQNMAIGDGLIEYVTTAINNIYNIVNRSGVQMLIFLAGLQSISPAIYESVQIDGATSWETFWKITFPMISPMILVNLVYTIIDSFTAESNTVMSFIKSASQAISGDYVSTAMSWMYFLIVILLIAALAGLLSTVIFYQRRDK